MIVFPAIDLKGGQVVRLSEGDMARATVYGDDPAAQAMLFAEAGSQFLHVVDLDGSFAGRAENRAAVEAILEVFPGHVQLGGGIRTREAVEGSHADGTTMLRVLARGSFPAPGHRPAGDHLAPAP